MERVVLVSVLLISLLLFTGCDAIKKIDVNETFKNYRQHDNISIDEEDIGLNITVINNTQDVYIPSSDRDVRIGSFNVQIFGVSKADNKPVMKALVDIIEDYDIIAFQEIRDISGTAFQDLMKEMPEKNYIISKRLGRTSSKEAYAFIYDPSIRVNRDQVYPDEEDVFERPPYMAEFTIKGASYVFIQVHTKPTDAQEEIKHLEEVVEYAVNYYGNINVVIMGDLNADCSYYKPGMYLNSYEWLISDIEDTTTGKSDCTYDRIITTQDYGDRFYACGVDVYDDDDITDKDLIAAISDHWPVQCMINI